MKKIYVLMAVAMAAVSLYSCSKIEPVAADYKVSVIFNALGGDFDGKATFDTVVYAGSEINAPSVSPAYEGYVFAGWYVDSECLTPVTFPVPVNADKIYYAKWYPVDSEWRVSGMTIEWYYKYSTLLPIMQRDPTFYYGDTYDYPYCVYDYRYHSGDDGELDSLSIVYSWYRSDSQSSSRGSFHYSISFENDTIYYGGKAVGLYDMGNGRFSSFGCLRGTGGAGENALIYEMEYDDGGYLSNMSEYEKYKIWHKTTPDDSILVDTLIILSSISDLSIENGCFDSYNIILYEQGMPINVYPVSYRHSDICNEAKAPAFSPGMFYWMGWDASNSVDNGTKNDKSQLEYYICSSITMSPFVGESSDFIPRTIANEYSYLILDDQYTIINPQTGYVTQLGYVYNNYHMCKLKFDYVPAN